MNDPIIVGITGRAHTGKDTAADYMAREYGFVRAAFADPIRSMLEQMLTEAGIDYAWLYEPHLKNAPIAELGGVSARQMMQTLGTEWGRVCMGDDWWIRLLERHLGLQPGSAPVHDRIVICDVRFPNEAAWIGRFGGKVVRLRRRQAQDVRAHESEAHINGLHAHAEIDNDGPSLYSLHHSLDDVLAGWDIDRRDGLEVDA